MQTSVATLAVDDRDSGKLRQEPEEDLMGRIAEGDRQAFGRLLDRYWRRLVIYAADITGAEDPAKDVVQEAFIRVWRHRDRWTRTGSVSAYLYRITHNVAQDELRRARARRRWRERQKVEAALSPGPVTPSDRFASMSVRQEIERAISDLPERRRQAFILARFHGLTHREIAEVMGISPQTVSNQMSAALSALRKTLSQLMDDA